MAVIPYTRTRSRSGENVTDANLAALFKGRSLSTDVFNGPLIGYYCHSAAIDCFSLMPMKVLNCT